MGPTQEPSVLRRRSTVRHGHNRTWARGGERRTRLTAVSRSRPEAPPFLRVAGEAVLVGVVYYVAAHFSLRLSLIHRNVTPLWPPSGIAVAAFLLIRRSVWPGVAVAAFLVNLPISANPLAAALTAAGNTVA